MSKPNNLQANWIKIDNRNSITKIKVYATSYFGIRIYFYLLLYLLVDCTYFLNKEPVRKPSSIKLIELSCILSSPF